MVWKKFHSILLLDYFLSFLGQPETVGVIVEMEPLCWVVDLKRLLWLALIFPLIILNKFLLIIFILLFICRTL